MRTMPDGSKRPVKFDGIQAEYVIDRKWGHKGCVAYASPSIATVAGVGGTSTYRNMGGPHPFPEGQSAKAAEEYERHQHQSQGGEAMIAVQIARIVARFVVFADLTDEDLLDPDVAVEMMEVLGADLEGLEKGFLRQLVDAFAVVADEYSGEAQEVVRNIAYGFYLEEALAADDPVRLAELEALRDARG